MIELSSDTKRGHYIYDLCFYMANMRLQYYLWVGVQIKTRRGMDTKTTHLYGTTASMNDKLFPCTFPCYQNFWIITHP